MLFKKLANSRFVSLFAKGVMLGENLKYDQQRRYADLKID